MNFENVDVDDGLIIDISNIKYQPKANDLQFENIK